MRIRATIVACAAAIGTGSGAILFIMLIRSSEVPSDPVMTARLAYFLIGGFSVVAGGVWLFGSWALKWRYLQSCVACLALGAALPYAAAAGSIGGVLFLPHMLVYFPVYGALGGLGGAIIWRLGRNLNRPPYSRPGTPIQSDRWGNSTQP